MTKMLLKYYQPFLKTLKDNTNINYHVENGVLIAVNFGSEIQKNEMKYLQNEHKKDGYLTYSNSIAQRYLIKDILNNMKYKKLAKEIYKQL